MTVEQQSVSPTSPPLCERIIQEVAATKSVSALDLAPLYTVVDPDALESVFSKSSQQGEIEFEYEGCTVHIDGDSSVTITG